MVVIGGIWVKADLRTIRYDSDGDVAPLNEVECDLLDGIASDADRYGIYTYVYT